MLFDKLPDTLNVPALIVVAPVYVLAPLKVKVPTPCLIKVTPVPAISTFELLADPILILNMPAFDNVNVVRVPLVTNVSALIVKAAR